VGPASGPRPDRVRRGRGGGPGGRRRQRRGPGAPGQTTAAARGRGRGGQTTERHLARAGKGRPLAAALTDGRRHDCTRLEAVLDANGTTSGRGAHRPGRKPAFAREAYRRRDVVARCVDRLQRWRGIAPRFEKRAATYRAMAVVAALMIWLGQRSVRQALNVKHEVE
jgi:transposase